MIYGIRTVSFFTVLDGIHVLMRPRPAVPRQLSVPGPLVRRLGRKKQVPPGREKAGARSLTFQTR